MREREPIRKAGRPDSEAGGPQPCEGWAPDAWARFLRVLASQPTAQPSITLPALPLLGQKAGY